MGFFGRNSRSGVAHFKCTNLIMTKRRLWKYFSSSAKFINSIDFFPFPKLYFSSGSIFGDNFVVSFLLMTRCYPFLLWFMSDFLFVSLMLRLFANLISTMSFLLNISLEKRTLKWVSYICFPFIFKSTNKSLLLSVNCLLSSSPSKPVKKYFSCYELTASTSLATPQLKLRLKQNEV